MKCKKEIVTVVLSIFVICGCEAMKNPIAKVNFHLTAPKVDCVDVPVRVTVDLPEEFAEMPIEEICVVVKEQGKADCSVPGQIVKDEDNKTQLWWIAPRIEANSVSKWIATLSRKGKAGGEVFCWKDNPGEYLDLLFDGRKVLRYMYACDDSTPERFLETYKPFHHVFDAQGENLLTNGNAPDSLYPHHRGILIGWRQLEFGGKEYNFWHMDKKNGAVQEHQNFLQKVEGPVLAKSKSLIYWNDREGEPIIAEQRQVTVFRQNAPTILLLEFVSHLKAVNGDVFLNGDAEHAGFQYRAHNDVDKGSKDVKATYLFHKDNIDPYKDKNLPWVAMSYGLNDRRYSVQHINHPNNPKPTYYSAYRDYGRFGSFFKQKINDGETLTLRYRIFVVEGDMPDREKMANGYLMFINGPKVEVIN